MRTTRADKEIAEFIASMKPADVVAFQPSKATRDRVWGLVAKEKDEGLSKEETTELDHYMELEHIMRLAKAHARKILSLA